MSYFIDAFTKTLHHEGGYVFDPDDVGGETYKGISRVYNKGWTGWKTIDDLKSEDDFPKNLERSEILQVQVQGLYKQKYFDPYMGDTMCKELAMEMFDTSVNMGVGRAVKFLQIALNVLNRNASMYPDMVEDGDYGRTTHTNLQTYLMKDGVAGGLLLVKMINVLQGMHYINYMKKSPKQEKYARGWFKRVSIGK